MNTYVMCLLGLIVFCMDAHAQARPPHWLTEGPHLNGNEAEFAIPIEVLGSKMYVEVMIGGKPRRFVVDTGSPSMIDKSLVRKLGLEIVGKNKGTDAHGVVIESDIVQAALTVGGVTIDKIPMFAADFTGSPVTQCFIGDGVLGSELLPLGAWQIDLANKVLRFNTDVRKLPFTGNATKTRLYSFGYPHSPILDVRFAKNATSKAMFDSGSPAYFALSPQDFDGADRARGVGNVITGYGSPGGSLGGQAPMGQQRQIELTSLSIDKVKLGRVGAIQRDLSPSLIGAGMLKHFVVTFDVKNNTAYFAQHADGPFAHPSFGFTLAFDENLSVATVWNDSPAQEAGLRPGVPLTSINGSTTDLSCEGIRQSLDAMSAQKINVEWNTGSAVLSHKINILDK